MFILIIESTFLLESRSTEDVRMLDTIGLMQTIQYIPKECLIMSVIMNYEIKLYRRS